MFRTLVFLLISACTTAVSADNFHRRNSFVQVRQDGFVVVNGVPYVPYAVPVGVPVANLSQATYSLDATQYTAPKYDHSARASTSDDETKVLLRALIAEVRAMKTGSAVQATEAGPNTAPPEIVLSDVLNTACMRCHSGTSPKGKTRFDLDLTPALRLAMLHRAQAGDMPPDKPLTGEQMGSFVQQMTAKAEVTTQAEPPPAPEPPMP